MLLQSGGLRLSLVGALIFFVSAFGLLFLPNLGPTIGILVGGMLVWIGFMKTLFQYYGPSPPSDVS